MKKLFWLIIFFLFLAGPALAKVGLGAIKELPSVIPSTLGGIMPEETPERIVEIKVVGNVRTEVWLIIKEFGIEVGDYFVAREVEEGLQRLRNLEYFYKVSYGIRRNQKGMVLTLVVEDRLTLYPTFNLGSGGGYNTVQVGLADRNFLGKGMTLMGEYEFANTQTAYRGKQSQKYLFRTDYTLDADFAYLDLRDQPFFDQGMQDKYQVRFVERGGSLTIGRRFGYKRFLGIKSTVFTHSYSDSKIDKHNDDFNDDSWLPKLKNGRTSMLKAVFKWRGVDMDDYIYDGYYGALEVGIADRAFGSEFSFGQLEIVQKYFWNKGIHNLCLSLRLHGNSSKRLQHKFTIGGTDGVRGFLYRQFRGNRAGVFNLEYRFSAYNSKEIYIQGVTFGDAARIWDYGEPGGLYEDSIISAGVGFRIALKRIYKGIGRVDLARTIEPYESLDLVMGVQQYF